MANRVLLVCGVALLCVQLAFGHGFLQVPISRNLIANKKGQEYCHHCLSAGGPSVVQSLTPGGKFPTPTETVTSAVRSSLCGEAANIPAAQRKYNPSPVPTLASLPVYQPGQVMDIEVVITAHHRGHFEFRLCDASKLSDPKTVNWACLKTLLKRVPVEGEVSPVDVNYPERYYLEPECAPNYNKTIKMKYQLPSDLTCERCVMQWWWVSANTCNPPGYAQRTPLPNHPGCAWWVPNLGTCGSSYPEEFWNCADISIGGAVAAPGTNTAPPPTKPVAPPVAPPVKPAVPPAQPVAPPTKPAAPVAPPAKPVAPPTKPVAPPAVPAKPVAPPAKPVAPPTKPAAPPAKPVAPPAKPVAPPAKPVAPPAKPAAPTSTCNKSGAQCGGIGWSGATCCASGTTCYKYTESYSQCRAGSCPAGWLCTAESSMLTSAVQWAKGLLQ